MIELRKESWQPRHDSAGPKLISEIHSDVRSFILLVSDCANYDYRLKKRRRNQLDEPPVQVERDYLDYPINFHDLDHEEVKDEITLEDHKR